MLLAAVHESGCDPKPSCATRRTLRPCGYCRDVVTCVPSSSSCEVRVKRREFIGLACGVRLRKKSDLQCQSRCSPALTR